MQIPFPHQIQGSLFLAKSRTALLADEQRVGKTGAAIMGCDFIFANPILVITKASARANWRRDFRTWGFRRNIQVIFETGDKIDPSADVVVIGWNMTYSPRIFSQLSARHWHVIILDESHEAKNPASKRTRAVYGVPDAMESGLVNSASIVWCLSGTPIPNAPIDIHPMLQALAPSRLAANPEKGWPEVLRFSDFRKRYCKYYAKIFNPKPMRLVFGDIQQFRGDKLNANPAKGWADVSTLALFTKHYGVSKTKGIHKNVDEFITRINMPAKDYTIVATEGKNEAELKERMAGFWLRRTQADVGIRPPIFSVMALYASNFNKTALAEMEEDLKPIADKILASLESGVEVDRVHLARIRSVTGLIKAHAIVEAAEEVLDDGLDKLVIMAWHTNVIDALRAGLQKYNPVVMDGRTPPQMKHEVEHAFLHDPLKRVFIGQMVSAGEAIDCSSAAELWFAEWSFTPKDMAQAAMRITNHTQTRQPIVKVCALEGSIDEALMEILTRKVASIKQIMEK